MFEGHTGDTACDHCHQYEEDVAIMRDLGLDAYRLSLSWPRILPEGTGRVNEAGLDFYDRLIDTLLIHGVEPWVTLFHWDYPQALFDRGGWLDPASPAWFAEYVSVAVERLSDRVTHWITLNEPQCFIGLGHQGDHHAPGLNLPFADVLQAAHHVLLAHGRAVQVIRAQARWQPRVGAAPVGRVMIPATQESEDIDAARRAMFAVPEQGVFNNSWFADPMILGRYPEDGVKRFGDDMPAVTDEEMQGIRQPLDFYGVNIYTGERVRANADGNPERVPHPPGQPITMMGWPVVSEALYWGPRFLQERYDLPIVITENGIANMDWVHADGCVHDPQRIDFYASYLRQYRRAIQDGVDAKGFFAWSILDNFEWAFGYSKRFGLVHVDFETQKRTLKDSAHWYRDVIASNGANL